MARERVLKVGCLNVANESERPEIYMKLIHEAFMLKRAIELSSNKYMILNHCEFDSDHVTGTFARFNTIDPKLPWFDSNNLSEPDDISVKEISIPDHLRPNFVSFYFFFEPQKHKLTFELKSGSTSITHNEVKKFFSTLLNQIELQKAFGGTYVSVVSKEESVEQIFSELALKRLTIRIQRPNPDDHGDIGRRIRDRLKNQNAGSIIEILEAAPGSALEPDESTRALAEVATTNGEVRATGRDANGTVVTRSTQEFPAVETIGYNPEHGSNFQAFMRATLSLLF
jgi:hypothetical protein